MTPKDQMCLIGSDRPHYIFLTTIISLKENTKSVSLLAQFNYFSKIYYGIKIMTQLGINNLIEVTNFKAPS